MTANSFTHMILENQRFRMPAGLDQVQVEHSLSLVSTNWPLCANRLVICSSVTRWTGVSGRFQQTWSRGAFLEPSAA